MENLGGDTPQDKSEVRIALDHDALAKSIREGMRTEAKQEDESSRYPADETPAESNAERDAVLIDNADAFVATVAQIGRQYDYLVPQDTANWLHSHWASAQKHREAHGNDYARKLLEAAVVKHGARLARTTNFGEKPISREDLQILTPDDFKNGAQDIADGLVV